MILADQAQEALRARDITRAEGLVAELIRDHPSFPQGAAIQRQIEQWRARLADAARIAALVNAEQWQAAVEEIDRLGLRTDGDSGRGRAGAEGRRRAGRRARPPGSRSPRRAGAAAAGGARRASAASARLGRRPARGEAREAARRE